MIRWFVSVLLLQRVAARSAIVVFREYDTHGQKLLTFALSNFDRFDIDHQCNEENFGSRVPLAQLVSVAVGNNALLQELFDDRSKADGKIRFIGAQSQVILGEVKSERRVSDFFEKDVEEEKGNKVWIINTPQTEMPQGGFCYTNNMILGYVIAVVLLQEDLWSFDLSISAEALNILNNIKRDIKGTPLVLLNQNELRGDRTPTKIGLTSHPVQFSIGKASDYKTKSKNPNVKPFLPTNLEDEIWNNLKSSGVSNKVVLELGDQPLLITNKPQGKLRLFFFYDMFSFGDFKEISYNPAATTKEKTPIHQHCDVKSITISPMNEKDAYAVLFHCSKQYHRVI